MVSIYNVFLQGPYGPPGLKGEIGMPGRPVSSFFYLVSLSVLTITILYLFKAQYQLCCPSSHTFYPLCSYLFQVQEITIINDFLLFLSGPPWS